MASPEMKAEGFTRVTYEIEEGKGGVSKLTVTHELESAPLMAKRSPSPVGASSVMESC